MLICFFSKFLNHQHFEFIISFSLMPDFRGYVHQHHWRGRSHEDNRWRHCRRSNSSRDAYLPLKVAFGRHHPTYAALVRRPEGVTGILMVVFMAVAFILATRWFRRSLAKLPRPFYRLTGFNVFWYSHHLFVIVYILLVIHGCYLYLVHEWYQKTTWMYLVVPVLLYAFERIVRFFRSGFYSVRLRKDMFVGS